MSTSLGALDGLVAAIPVKEQQVKQYLQISMGVVITTAVAGVTYYPMFSAFGERLADDWYRGWQWAAITVLLTTMPFLGQTIRTNFERVCGTALGGL
eukprot:scaffold23748_cov39-Prasinocladus_malaysianus.AAC.1